MRIAMIGTGYVGLVSGACFAEFGAFVTCIDNDAEKIERLSRGEIGIYETGLAELVAGNKAAGRLRFTTELTGSIGDADVIFIAVGTPSHSNGDADLSGVYDVVQTIGSTLSKQPTPHATIVTKSTVPVGTSRDIARRLGCHLSADQFSMASNPEFLREGSAIADFMRPERIIIGTESERARQTMRSVYRPIEKIATPILFTTLEAAELIKYTANSFLATKIAFINEVANLCNAVGADIEDVARGIGLDSRIGRQFLQAGPGFGGSCFPKDCRALVSTAEKAGTPLSIVAAVLRANEERKRAMVRQIAAACDGVAGKTLAILGLTFKPDTDDMRESPSLVILPALLAAGAVLRVYDPEGMEQARKLMPDLNYCSDAYDALDGADAAVVLTEWSEFRDLDPERLARQLTKRVVIDLRNIYRPQRMAAAGLFYHSIGRALAAPAAADAAASAEGLLPMMAADS